jgi:integrase
MGQKRMAGRQVLKKGEGQRSNGTFYYRWVDRKGERRVIYSKTLTALREREKEMERDAADGIKYEARYVTVNDMYKAWKDIKRGLRDSTFMNYTYMYETFVEPTFGKSRISQVKKSDVKHFYNTLADERNLKAATIDSIHTVIHQVFEMAVEDMYIRANPADNALKELKRSHVYKSEKRRGLTLPEQELLLKFLKKSKYVHWYPVIAVMAGTGMRVGEVTGLRWQDIDLDKGIIDVNHSLIYYNHREEGYKSGSYFNVHQPKTEAGIRQVPMIGFVKEAFLMEREYQKELGITCNSVIDGYTDFIFLNRNGEVYGYSQINKAIKRIIRDCNDEQFLKSETPDVLLPNFSCHNLRHTFTTRMCEAGVNVKLMQDILGHTDISTTLNIYADATKELREKEMGNLEQYFAGMGA